MIESLNVWAMDHAVKLQLIAINRLQDIQTELRVFKENEDLNGFQKWIINDLYQFGLPSAGFTIRSMMILAIPHPFYAAVEFERHAKKYNFLSPVMSDFVHTEKKLNDFLASKNYHILPASNIPLKRLAVKSGLAVYGKNNICYVEGMGSIFSFAGYFSDVLCDDGDWMELRQSDRCHYCWACANNCPTGAIRKNRFLINNERCLSNLNESPGEFPEWLPASVHHCLYDCLKCQISCPMNQDFLKNTIGPIQFNEDETEMLLSGSPFDTFPPEMRQKTNLLGLDQWSGSIPRNLQVLFELSNPV
jgi:epoxyqueuosine reductase